LTSKEFLSQEQPAGCESNLFSWNSLADKNFGWFINPSSVDH